MRIPSAVFLTAVLFAESSYPQNATVTRSSFAMGSGVSAPGLNTVRSVAGEVLTGSGISANTRVEAGFLSVVAADTFRAGPGPGFILYSRAGSPEGTVWMKTVDGSVDTPMFAGVWPRLSHDGRSVVHHRGANQAPWFQSVYLYDLQSTRDTLLFGNNDYIQNYSWAPDDSTIVFDYLCYIKRVNRDGSPRSDVLNVDCYDDVPMFNGNGWAIAFHNAFLGIMLTDSLGINRHHVPNTLPGDYWPAWSPDGQWISFSRSVGDTIQNYYKIHPDGTGLTPLTFFGPRGLAIQEGGSWTPDGTKIIVAARVRDTGGIYAIATDGSGGTGLIPTAPGDPVDFVGSVTGNINLTLTGVEKQPLPTRAQLEQNFPNPFNPGTEIHYQLSGSGMVTLKVYDILGREVRVLVNERKSPGSYSVRFNASALASGVYIYRLTAGEFVQTRRMIFLK